MMLLAILAMKVRRPMLSKNATELINSRYKAKNESVEGVFQRVARVLSINDKKFEKELYTHLINGIFLPNSPCLRNAGRKRGMLHACFILPCEDNMTEIFDTIKNMATIFKYGGGVGINFSRLRPLGAPLSSGGTSSGAISFMGIFNAITETVKQGGFRRGALMGIQAPEHPEILNFCRAKLKGDLTNFNLSIMVTDKFMKKAINHGSIELVHDGTVYNKIRARDILDLVALGTWVTGDPGLLFQDRINQDNRLYPKVVLDTTNPCSEVALPPFGACCLGSINLSKFVEGDFFNFTKFSDTLQMATRALLHVNLLGYYPISHIAKLMLDLNPIGVGIMGFADTLIMLGIKYDSQECLNFIDQLAVPYKEITNALAPDSFYKRIIAPTGSLSILADCSQGIEPIFDRAYVREVVAGTFVEGKSIYSSECTRTAHEVSPDWHLQVQAKWQSVLDGGCSKTINVPNNTSVDEIKKIYIKAWKMKVKGVTIFRDGSIPGVLKSIKACDEGGESCPL